MYSAIVAQRVLIYIYATFLETSLSAFHTHTHTRVRSRTLKFIRNLIISATYDLMLFVQQWQNLISFYSIAFNRSMEVSKNLLTLFRVFDNRIARLPGGRASFLCKANSHSPRMFGSINRVNCLAKHETVKSTECVNCTHAHTAHMEHFANHSIYYTHQKEFTRGFAWNMRAEFGVFLNIWCHGTQTDRTFPIIIPMMR